MWAFFIDKTITAKNLEAGKYIDEKSEILVCGNSLLKIGKHYIGKILLT